MLSKLTFVILVAIPLLAQADRRQAARLFAAGQKSYKQGNYLAAIRAFEQSQRVKPHPVTLFATAQAHRRQYERDHKPSRARKAAELYGKFIKASPRSRWARAAKTHVAELLASLKQRAIKADRGSKASARSDPQTPCSRGKLVVSGHCCWPGQDWGVNAKRCVGEPSCPDGFLRDQSGCKAGCPRGMVLLGGHCCWPGQDWGASTKRCIGAPRCPPHLKAKGATCAPPSRAGERWVRIRGGVFQMGSAGADPDQRPVHTVRLKDHWILETEVTVNQFRACSRTGVCKRPPQAGGERCNLDQAGRGRHPMNCVDVASARAFCRWVGGRLPSESEWEYAARSGGKSQPYPWGSHRPSCKRAIMDGGAGDGCGLNRTSPVCAKPGGKTAQGLCDMAGNVWELVADCYQDSYKGAPSTGAPRSRCDRSFAKQHVVRGGSYYEARARFLKATYRNRTSPTLHRFGSIGFRCAKTTP